MTPKLMEHAGLPDSSVEHDDENMPPEILDAIRSQYEAMGFGFNPEGLSRYLTDEGLVSTSLSMGLSPQEIACLLIERYTVAEIEYGLPKCVQSLGSNVLISMPLDDLRFAYGYLALVEARAKISLDQTKRAIQIAIKLATTAPDASERT
jgi:hypothetical protein